MKLLHLIPALVATGAPLALLGTVAPTAAAAPLVQASIPNQLQFQTRLLDDLGNTVNQNGLQVRFVVYSSATGGSAHLTRPGPWTSSTAA